MMCQFLRHLFKALTAAPPPHPPHLCKTDPSRAGSDHSLLSDLSCNYDNMRFAVVLLEKSLD
uniref:Macaca fascicularis brain cDNA clone: QflA-23787, similar to human RW1 protein (RW1), mRNA, RefSeq: XM_371542.2 n=1 Tax=Macaca fascicularis TaxID=9541 RepID=I7GMV4_MACFA|nr:unnamed protein product [Macaca fascicularis]